MALATSGAAVDVENDTMAAVLQDEGGSDILGSRVRDQRHPAEQRRETRCGHVHHRRLQEEMPHRK